MITILADTMMIATLHEAAGTPGSTRERRPVAEHAQPCARDRVPETRDGRAT
jgi:hypothetical protein